MIKKVCEACGQVHRVKEPSQLGQARYDPLIDIAYEQLKAGFGGEVGRMARVRIEMAGGMQHVEAMRSRVQL